MNRAKTGPPAPDAGKEAGSPLEGASPSPAAPLFLLLVPSPPPPHTLGFLSPSSWLLGSGPEKGSLGEEGRTSD